MPLPPIGGTPRPKECRTSSKRVLLGTIMGSISCDPESEMTMETLCNDTPYELMAMGNNVQAGLTYLKVISIQDHADLIGKKLHVSATLNQVLVPPFNSRLISSFINETGGIVLFFRSYADVDTLEIIPLIRGYFTISIFGELCYPLLPEDLMP